MELQNIGYMRSPVGCVKITADNEYITSISLIGDASNINEASIEVPLLIRECMDELDEYFTGKRTVFTVPMKQEGTDFQQEVWSELLKIPYGSTISYGELAKRLGDPKLTRAVGAANGKNKLWIAVPCHRVIGANGSLTGYAGGIECKRWLLQHEAAFGNKTNKLF